MPYKMGGSPSQEVKTLVQNEITSNKVMVFSKTTCGYCRMAKQVFDDLKVPYNVIELNKRNDGSEIQSELQRITGASTVPRVFINGKCIGGGTETKQLADQGELMPKINPA